MRTPKVKHAGRMAVIKAHVKSLEVSGETVTLDANEHKWAAALRIVERMRRSCDALADELKAGADGDTEDIEKERP